MKKERLMAFRAHTYLYNEVFCQSERHDLHMSDFMRLAVVHLLDDLESGELGDITELFSSHERRVRRVRGGEEVSE